MIAVAGSTGDYFDFKSKSKVVDPDGGTSAASVVSLLYLGGIVSVPG
jgi:hypothetical protein